ncbi:MAG: acyl-CoA dehydrogenase family protein [Phenylobacterium sp.]|uniref:acyl-CoA dehydrogenase family protein n=1 Tax=Phenylobacterium sp. TaxID=1871053 RepID=UPI0027346381|nr:acyl-CoA dehydrogenase family protein [Phenylobacterium sp.]MDP3173062.1 acyl-CoA dehydrogenase family protein [Phenylobacterium sp.]
MSPDNLVADTAARMFAELADAQSILISGRDDWKAPLWSALEEVGLPLAWVSDAAGGGGASLEEGFAVILEAGRSALAAPLVETLLAGWLLAQADLTPPPGPLSVAPSRPGDVLLADSEGRISGRAQGVPFAREVEHLAVVASGPDGPVVALVRTADCRLELAENLAGDARDTVVFEHVQPAESGVFGVTGADVQLSLLMLGATARGLQISGALDKILRISVQYSQERVAFGKSISKFQAIQHNLARLAGEVAAATAASGSAAEAVATTGFAGDAMLLEVAASKIRTGEAAELGARIAHQVHGAIGFTEEHILHRFTLRMLSWRDDFGNDTFWSLKLGERIAGKGADELWPLMASR